MIIDAPASRLGIYFFYDEHGVVDDYVTTFLRGMAPHLTRLIVVVNGELDEAGRRAFELAGASPLIVRPNEGFDVWAYKAGLDHVGWSELAQYDEIVMMNFTIMGPVGSFEPMFSEMDGRDLDFWGITIHNGAPFDPWDKMPDGTIPLHLQSHFIAVRSSMHTSAAFRRYWDRLGPIESYEDSIAKHEAIFTERFADLGFTWSAFVDTTDLIDQTYYPLFNMPVDLIENRGSPIFKRKSFFAGLELYLDENSNRPARELLDYLTQTDRYDVDLVWQHITRSANHHDVAMALNLFEVLDSSPASRASRASVGAIVGVMNRDDLDSALGALASLPEGASVVIVHPVGEPTLRGIRSVLAATRWGDAALVPARTPEEPWSPLTFAGDHLDSLDLVCVIGPAAAGAFPFTNVRAAERNARDAVLGSEGYAARVLDVFDQRPRLGMLVPPRALHFTNFGEYGHEWGESFDDVRDQLMALGIQVPITPWKAPVGPANGTFWIRGEVMASEVYQRMRARVADPEMIALILPFIVQAQGRYASYVMPDFLAANYLTNFTYIIRRSNQRLGLGAEDSFSTFQSRLQAVSFGSTDQIVREEFTAHLYLDYGTGFTERESVIGIGTVSLGSGTLTYSFTVPPGVRAIRFDPVEGVGCTCVSVSAVADQGRRVRLVPINGVRRGRFDIFETTDPQFVAYTWSRRSTELTVTMESMTFLRPPFRRERKRRGIPLLWHKARRVVGRFRVTPFVDDRG